MQQLRKHGVTRMLARVFGLKPNRIGLDVYQSFGQLLQAQSLNVRVFNIFFRLGFL